MVGGGFGGFFILEESGLVGVLFFVLLCYSIMFGGGDVFGGCVCVVGDYLGGGCVCY